VDASSVGAVLMVAVGAVTGAGEAVVILAGATLGRGGSVAEADDVAAGRHAAAKSNRRRVADPISDRNSNV
jgi:hypothetical protein